MYVFRLYCGLYYYSTFLCDVNSTFAHRTRELILNLGVQRAKDWVGLRCVCIHAKLVI